MEEGPILRVTGLTKKFYVDPRLGRKPGYKDLIRLMLGFHLESDHLRENEFYALNHVSFDLHRGEALGVMGLNGAGKSTLLKVLLGRLPLDSGAYNIRGSVGGLVELNAGFHMEMTGLENVYNRARMLGKSDKEVEQRLAEIIDFADLGDFINSPVKTYSSGMNVRLGFSIAIHFVDDLVLCDEVLAVGDFDFRQKCLSKINELRRKKSFVLVSHSNPDIATFCDRAIILHKGDMVFHGTPADAIEAYAQCSHHLTSNEVKSRIEKSLSLNLKGKEPKLNEVVNLARRYFFLNFNFENRLENWNLSEGDASVNFETVNGITSASQTGEFVLKQEIDRECLLKLTADLSVHSGELELVSRTGEKRRVVNKWSAGFQGRIDESFKSNCLEYHCNEVEKFPEGLNFNLKNISVSHDVELVRRAEPELLISENAKLSLFGPEYHRKEIVANATLEWNLRKREQGFYYVSGDLFTFKIGYTLKKDVSSLRIGIPFFKEDGEMLLGPDSRNYGKKDKLRRAGRHEVFMVIDPLPVNAGRLWFTLTLCEDPAHLFRKHITCFDVINPAHEYGLVKSFPVWMENWSMENANLIYSMD